MVHLTIRYDEETGVFTLLDEAGNTILKGTLEEVRKGKIDDAYAQFVSAARHTAYISRN